MVLTALGEHARGGKSNPFAKRRRPLKINPLLFARPRLSAGRADEPFGLKGLESKVDIRGVFVSGMND